jgi:hypothetical protein
MTSWAVLAVISLELNENNLNSKMPKLHYFYKYQTIISSNVPFPFTNLSALSLLNSKLKLFILIIKLF